RNRTADVARLELVAQRADRLHRLILIAMHSGGDEQARTGWPASDNSALQYHRRLAKRLTSYLIREIKKVENRLTMKRSLVKQRWSRNQAALCFCLHLTDPAAWELTSLLGFECIWMDLEHRSPSVQTAENLMRAARVGGSDILA